MYCCQVEATDTDSGTYGDITYSIVEVTNDGEEKFDIDSDTGQISIEGTVTRGDRFVLSVRASDRATSNKRYIICLWNVNIDYISIIENISLCDITQHSLNP